MAQIINKWNIQSFVMRAREKLILINNVHAKISQQKFIMIPF